MNHFGDENKDHDRSRLLEQSCLTAAAQSRIIIEKGRRPKTMAQLLLVLFLLLAASPPVAFAQQVGGRFGALRNAPIPGPDAPVLSGYDLVEYHNLQANQDGVLGKESISHRLDSNGYLYYFSTEANRELFIQNPEKYLPKYGGFGAWGMAWGWPWAANHVGPPCGPSDGWAILSDGRLYCSIYRHYQDDFNLKQQEGLRLADERWIAWYGSLNAGPQNNGCYAWNWQECFARSIHTSVENTTNKDNNSAVDTPALSDDGADDDYEVKDSSSIQKFNVSQVFGNEAIEATWSEPIQAMMGILTFQWTILEDPSSFIPSLDTSTTTKTTSAITAAAETVVTTNNGDDTQEQERSPQIVVQLSATNIASDEYIAFGVAEQLMQGPLVACFSLDDADDMDDGTSTYNVTSTCRTLRGNGMGTSILSDDEAKEQRLNVQVLWSTRNSTHYTVRLAMRMLGLIPHDPRHASMSRVVFCRGKVSGDGSPQPHANNIWNRQAVRGIEWLSVLRNGNNINAPVVDDDEKNTNSIDWLLPAQDLWIPLKGSNGIMSVLNDRVHVAYQLFRHYSNNEDDEGRNTNNDLDDNMKATSVQEIVEIQLQNVEYNIDGYTDDSGDNNNNVDAYIGFAFAKDTMSGLVITCSIGAGIDGQSACKQWHGEGTNLYPISTNDNGNGGWFVTGVAGNGTHSNFTFAGRVMDVVHSGSTKQEEEQQQTPFLSPDSSNLRAIISIGRSPSDTGNPLQHFPQDREAFQLDGLAAGTPPLSIVLQDDDTSTPLNKENSSNGPSSFSSTNIIAIAIVVVMNCLWCSSWK